MMFLFQTIKNPVLVIKSLTNSVLVNKKKSKKKKSTAGQSTVLAAMARRYP